MYEGTDVARLGVGKWAPTPGGTWELQIPPDLGPDVGLGELRLRGWGRQFFCNNAGFGFN